MFDLFSLEPTILNLYIVFVLHTFTTLDLYPSRQSYSYITNVNIFNNSKDLSIRSSTIIAIFKKKMANIFCHGKESGDIF